jgi:hypothetical protein
MLPFLAQGYRMAKGTKLTSENGAEEGAEHLSQPFSQRRHAVVLSTLRAVSEVPVILLPSMHFDFY